MLIISKTLNGWAYQHAHQTEPLFIKNQEVHDFLDQLSALQPVGDAALVAIATEIGWNQRDIVLLANRSRVIDLTTSLEAVQEALPRTV